MKSKDIEIKPSISPNIFTIGKKIYMLKEEKRKKGHIEKLVFSEVNEKKYNKDIDKIIEEILKTKEIDRTTILRQAFLNLSLKDIEKVKKGLKSFKVPKYKKGCLNIDIGEIEIPIFNKASFLD